MEAGPVLPERLKSPCVVQVSHFEVFFIMGTYLDFNGTGAFLYNVSTISWIDLSMKNPCFHNQTMSLSCAGLHQDKVVIAMLSNQKKLCTSYLDLIKLKWIKIRSQEDYLIPNGKILKPEEKSFVTFIASSQENFESLVFQVQCSPDLTNLVLTNHPGLMNQF